jgi:hypothetical protein
MMAHCTRSQSALRARTFAALDENVAITFIKMNAI